ncbi:MAG: glycosyltransferase family 4 protein [Candidatus Heimdallarchaeaceae archaeon]
MKVLMLASCYPTETEPYLCLFLKELEEQLVKHIQSSFVLSLHGYRRFRLFKRLLEIKRFIKEQEVDIVHAQFGYSAGFYGSLIKRKKPFIVTVHRFELFEKRKRPFVKYGLKKADLIIAVSNYIFREIVKLDKSLAEKTIVLPNGVNTDKYANKEVRLVKEEETIRIGTLAHHSKRKGIDKLIKAYKSLENKKDVELHIAGKGPETENLVELVKELNLKKVKFHGNISEQEKIEFYRMLDIFVLSSDSEGHPVALLESMCTGVCPVVSNIPAIEDTVFDKQNGRIFNLEDIKELSNILEEIVKDIDSLNTYKQNARKKVLEEFDLNKRAKRLSEIYQKLIH